MSVLPLSAPKSLRDRYSQIQIWLKATDHGVRRKNETATVVNTGVIGVGDFARCLVTFPQRDAVSFRDAVFFVTMKESVAVFKSKVLCACFLVACITSVVHSTEALAQSGSRNSVPSTGPSGGSSFPQPIHSAPPSSQPFYNDGAGQPGPFYDGNGGQPDGIIHQDLPQIPSGPVTTGSLWQQHDPTSQIRFDHGPWDAFLQRNVVRDCNGLNRVRYCCASNPDRRMLETYLKDLQAFDPRILQRNEQLVYWINLYNARTVALILEHYPVRSIRSIKTNLLDFVGPFDDITMCVLGQKLSLSDVENNILRANWNDNRLHYALNCASYGCPNLQSSAWTVDNLDQRLDSAAYEFVNSGRAVRTNFLGRLGASKIYDWYKDDFGGDDAAVIAHIYQYANPQTRQLLCGRREIGFHFYDWSLNVSR